MAIARVRPGLLDRVRPRRRRAFVLQLRRESRRIFGAGVGALLGLIEVYYDDCEECSTQGGRS